MAQSSTIDKAVRRTRWSWYFYDFGNSAYASVILLAVFSVYFSSVVVDHIKGPSLWNLAVGIAAVLVAVMSPVLGTIADFSRAKKKLLFVFTALSVICTGLLFFVQKGDVAMGMIFFILAEIGYRASQVFYDALLVDVSTPETIGKVSGNGWALGMLGGIVALILVLIPIQFIKIPGIESTLMVRISFLITAVFFAVSSIPVFLNVKQINEPEKLAAGESTFAHAFKKLGETFRDVKRYKEFIKYAIAFLIYNDGIMMLMDNASIIAAILYGFKTQELIILIIILQVAGAGGAFLGGWISQKFSSKQAILWSLIMLMGVVALLFFIQSKAIFYLIGALAGFSLSGVQAVSRTMVSQLSPQEKTAEFYGFLSVAGRTSTFVGPLVFGSVYALMINWYSNPAHGFTEAMVKANAMYWAIGSVIAFLLIGMLFLLRVRKVTHKDPIKFE
ncbi:MAG: MFS transporter [Veillonellaceae bacterium]|nr:MFS transporter [Veillonellaceae bacterium]